MIENNELERFLYHSYNLMKDRPEGKKYYHTLTPKDNSPVVVHDHTDQITYVVDGSGTAYLNGRKQEVRGGNIFLIQSGTTMRFIANSGGLTLFNIHVPDDGGKNDRRVLEGEDIDRYQNN